MDEIQEHKLNQALIRELEDERFFVEVCISPWASVDEHEAVFDIVGSRHGKNYRGWVSVKGIAELSQMDNVYTIKLDSPGFKRT